MRKPIGRYLRPVPLLSVFILGALGLPTSSELPMVGPGRDVAMNHRAAMVQQAVPPVTTVEHVNLDRYLGLWHEVARIPNRFQKQCIRRTTATYAKRGDGLIDVMNRCETEGGQFDEIKGVAKIEDTSTNARLKVSFVSLLGWRLFWGDYWIIGLDEDYRWAVVGTPNRKYGWILARTPNLDAQTRERAFGVLESNGYDPAMFSFSPP